MAERPHIVDHGIPHVDGVAQLGPIDPDDVERAPSAVLNVLAMNKALIEGTIKTSLPEPVDIGGRIARLEQDQTLWNRLVAVDNTIAEADSTFVRAWGGLRDFFQSQGIDIPDGLVVMDTMVRSYVPEEGVPELLNELRYMSRLLGDTSVLNLRMMSSITGFLGRIHDADVDALDDKYRPEAERLGEEFTHHIFKSERYRSAYAGFAKLFEGRYGNIRARSKGEVDPEELERVKVLYGHFLVIVMPTSGPGFDADAFSHLLEEAGLFFYPEVQPIVIKPYALFKSADDLKRVSQVDKGVGDVEKPQGSQPVTPGRRVRNGEPLSKIAERIRGVDPDQRFVSKILSLASTIHRRGFSDPQLLVDASRAYLKIDEENDKLKALFERDPEFHAACTYLRDQVFENGRYAAEYGKLVEAFMDALGNSNIDSHDAVSDSASLTVCTYFRYFVRDLVVPAPQYARLFQPGLLVKELSRVGNALYPHEGSSFLVELPHRGMQHMRAKYVPIEDVESIPQPGNARRSSSKRSRRSTRRQQKSRASHGFFDRFRRSQLVRRVALPILAAFGITSGVGTYGYVVGPKRAEEVIQRSKSKLPVGIVSGGENVGYLYGRRINSLTTNDKSIPVSPEELEKGGELYYAYQAVIAVEDQGHEGGITDKIGVDPIAMAYTFPRKVSHELIGFPSRDPGGASAVADQACNAMQDYLPYMFDERYKYNEYEGMGKLNKVIVKFNDTICGMGLAQIRDPREIYALYLTFGYFAGGGADGVEPFCRLYWGFDSIYDERLTIGHQMIIASMALRPWDRNPSPEQERQWARIVARSKLATDRLIEKGILTLDALRAEGIDVPEDVVKLSKEEQDTWIMETVYEQIYAARPRSKQDVQQSARGYSLTPKSGYDYLVERGIFEGEQVFGGSFRETVDTFELTSNGYVQGALIRALTRELGRVNHPAARGVGVLVNDDTGEIIAGFSGRLTDDGTSVTYDWNDRVFALRTELGSLGKLFLAVAAAKRGYTPHDRWEQVRDFRTSLKHSSSRIIRDSSRIGLDSEYVRELVNLFGDEHPDSKSFFEAATFGSFTTSPSQMLGLISAARDGEPAKPIRVIRRFHMRDGSVCAYADTGGLECVYGSEVYNFDELTPLYEGYEEYERDVRDAFGGLKQDPWKWFVVPLLGPEKDDSDRGTLFALNGVVDGGKTGTVGEKSTKDKSGTTKGAWVLVGTERVTDANGRTIVPPMSGVFGITADGYKDSSGNDINLGNELAGGTSPAYIARDTILKAQRRFKMDAKD